MNSAELQWIQDLTFAVTSGSGHQLVVDSAKEAGPTPMELLLIGTAGCMAMDVISILRKQRQPVEDLKVRVQGQRADEHPKVYTHITLEFVAVGDVDEHKLATAIELSETKYCSASAMMSKAAPIEITYRVERAG